MKIIHFLLGFVAFVAYYSIVSEYFFNIPIITFLACLITAPLGALVNLIYCFAPLFTHKIYWGVYWAALIPTIWTIGIITFALIKKERE